MNPLYTYIDKRITELGTQIASDTVNNTISVDNAPVFNIANLAFDTANAAFGSANNIPINLVFNTANAGYNTANLAFTTVNAAFGLANTNSGILSNTVNTLGVVSNVANAAWANANLAVSVSVSMNVSYQSPGYIVANTDAGLVVAVPAGNVFIVDSAHIAGKQFSIYNSSTSSPLTVTQNTSVTIRLANTTNSSGAPLTGNRTLSPSGVAKFLCVAANTYVIVSGTGVF